MDLTPYLDSLRRDLTATAAPGGAELTRAADLLAGSLESAARLCLLEALSDAAAEITTKLGAATVEVRLRGREADLVVAEFAPQPTPTAPPTPTDTTGDVARITLRLPESMKEVVEESAASEGVSVNTWLVRAIAAAISGVTSPPPTVTRGLGKRVTGFAQA